MKIGILHYSMPPTIGGVERVIAAHARLFRNGGHAVELLCDGRQGLMTEDFPWLAVPGFRNGGVFEEDRRAFVEFVLGRGLDVLMVHNVLTMPFCRVATAACHALAGRELRLISWVHDLAADSRFYSVGSDDLLRQHPPGARVVAVSPERAAAYQQITDHECDEVIPNGVDVFGELAGDLVRSRPELRGQLRGAFPILFHPTRLLRRKRIELGIHVIAELKKHGLTPRLLISGAPETLSGDEAAYRRELADGVISAGVEAEVIFLGERSVLGAPEIASLYGLADALFYPSEQEGFGLPILEAGVRGLPIFTSETQPLAALAKIHGLVFSLAMTPRELAQEIAGFFSNCQSSHVRRLVRRDFDWQGIYEKRILPLLQILAP